MIGLIALSAMGVPTKVALIDDGTLRPDLDGTFPLMDVRAADEYTTRRGKAVLRIA